MHRRPSMNLNHGFGVGVLKFNKLHRMIADKTGSVYEWVTIDTLIIMAENSQTRRQAPANLLISLELPD